jgi:uncharacterized protein (TIGR03067 family)
VDAGSIPVEAEDVMNWRALVVVAAVTAVAAGGPAPAKKKDLERLQGTWQLHSGMKEGVVASGDDIDKVKLTFEGNKVTLTEGGGDKTATVELDPAQKLPSMDIKLNAKELVKGIYLLDGDTLKLCVALPGINRPWEFASKANSGTNLMVFKRQKK